MSFPDNYLSIHANDTECYCQPGFICRICSHKKYKEALEQEESDDTIYKFTMNVKGDVAYANPKHGAYAKYEGYTVIRFATHRILNKEIMEFNAMGGKVIGIEREIATKICPECKSTVQYNFYNFAHDMCNDCVEINASEFTEKIKDKIDTILLANTIINKPKS